MWIKVKETIIKHHKLQIIETLNQKFDAFQNKMN